MGALDPAKIPRHVAIIPDGNGRWAESRGLPRDEGHARGVEVVRQIVEAAHERGVRHLTLYAFSMENWGRPTEEVGAIMRLMERYLQRETDELVERGVRVRAIGRLEMLRPHLQRRVQELARRTEANTDMVLTFALSYSGRTELVDAARRLARAVEAGKLEPDAIDEKALQMQLYAPDLPDPDLLIRTGGEHRISNFLLWQLAYTELWSTEVLWPDFSAAELDAALLEYQLRERRFGQTGAQTRGAR
jgi:undecaprenyl diphosphate synthase